MDNCKPGQANCHLLAWTVDQHTTEPLQYTITLDGAEPPHNAFNIFIDHGMYSDGCVSTCMHLSHEINQQLMALNSHRYTGSKQISS